MNNWNEDNFLDELAPLLRGRCPDPESTSAADLAAHAAHCARCAKLARRLEGFDAAREVEWSTAERRFDQWLANLIPAPVQPPRRRWRFEWLLIPALAAASLAALFLMRQPPSPQHAPQPAPLAAIQPPAAEAPAPPTARKDFESGLKEEMVHALRPGARQAKSPAPETQPPAQTAEATPEPPVSSGPVRPLAPDTVHAVSTSAAPADPGPPMVRVNAGTRVWIFLKSLDKKPDATFAFRGVVLLPVVQNGSVVLDRETEVYGLGRESQGKTSIQIQQFGSHGSQYRLTQSSRVPAGTPPGSADGLQFDAGQVLEMWLASVSTYERVP